MTNTLAISPSAFPGLEERPGRPTNIAQLLLRAAEWRPRSGLRLVSGDLASEPITQNYPDLLDDARHILGGLQTHDLRPGSKVALLLEHPADFIPAFWACVLGGYVPCPLVPIHGDQERWAKHLSHVNALLDHPLLVTTGTLAEGLSGLAVAQLDTLRTAPRANTVHKAAPEEPAILVLTSGSTGNSKAVILTHANLLASMAGKAERQELTAADITLNWISFDHVAALLEAHLLPLYVGAVQFHANPAAIVADPLLLLWLVDRHRVSMTFTPNFL